MVVAAQLTSDRHDTKPKQDVESLTAVELAYLLRKGDTGHCLAVMIVDSVQRLLKAPDIVQSDDRAAQYQQQLLGTIKRYLKTKATQKTTEIIDIRKLRTPSGLIDGLTKLKLFIVGRVRPFVKNMVRDPKHLKKYFSPAGIMRILADLYCTGIKDSLEHDLKTGLIKRGLLSSDEARTRCATRLWRIAVLSATIPVFVTWLLLWSVDVGVAIFFTLAAVLNGAALNIALAVRQFMPFYDEIATVLRTVDRRDLRLFLLRVLFNSARTIIVVAFLLIAAIFLTIESGISFQVCLPVAWLPQQVQVSLLLALSLNVFVCIKLALHATAVNNDPQPTASGSRALNHYRNSLKNLSPLQVLQETINSRGYDERLAMLVSLYGIETLWFLL